MQNIEAYVGMKNKISKYHILIKLSTHGYRRYIERT